MMESQVKVSIICNVFNHGKYVRDALNGFVMQKTNFPFEVLIHDDASSDNSQEIIKEYEQKYPELIKPIYQKENQYSQKIPINATFQIPRIKGKYVALCEGDDYWTDPMKLQKQYDFMEANPDYALCACSVEWKDMRTNKSVNLCRTSVDKDVSLDEILQEKRGRVFQYASVFIKADLFVNRPDWTKLFGVGDLPLAMYAATQGKVHMLADTMAVYRNHAEGSYTTKLSQSPKFVRATYEKVITGLNAFNEATNYIYDESVSKRINLMKYNIAKSERDVRAIWSPELKSVYKSKRLVARISDVLYCVAPNLQSFLTKILK